MTYREMRRKRLETSRQEALAVLKRAKYGVLATVNEKNEPRAVAVNHVLVDDNTLIFHGARSGEKMDNMAKNPQVSFFVVDHEEVIPEEYSTDYLSVSVQGHAEILEDEKEMYPYLLALAKHFRKDVSDEQIHDYTYPALIGKVAMTVIHIDDIKGKYHPAGHQKKGKRNAN